MIEMIAFILKVTGELGMIFIAIIIILYLRLCGVEKELREVKAQHRNGDTSKTSKLNRPGEEPN
jgi:hypothetical protein